MHYCREGYGGEIGGAENEGAENAGVDNSGGICGNAEVENMGNITYGKPSKQKTLRY